MEPGALSLLPGRMELCEEAMCLPVQNFLESDRNITFDVGLLQIHTGSLINDDLSLWSLLAGTQSLFKVSSAGIF